MLQHFYFYAEHHEFFVSVLIRFAKKEIHRHLIPIAFFVFDFVHAFFLSCRCTSLNRALQPLANHRVVSMLAFAFKLRMSERKYHPVLRLSPLS